MRETPVHRGPEFSFIMPVLNESALVLEAVHALDKLVGESGQKAELIVVDGGSSDTTLSLLENLHPEHLSAYLHIKAARGRATQMNRGAAQARGKLLVFLHADTRLPTESFSHLNRLRPEQLWGRFDVQLSNPAAVYRMISWFINQRSRLSSIATGDQAIFVRREVFEAIGGFAEQPLMEDIELSRRLKRLAKPYNISSPVQTSARKWEQGGVIRTILLMWQLRARYFFGADPDQLVRSYYGSSD